MTDTTKEIAVSLDSKTIYVTIRYSHKARNIAIRITRLGKAELVVPIRANLARAHEFLLSKSSWLEAKIRYIENVNLPDNQIPIFDKLHAVNHIISDEFLITKTEENIIVSCPDVMRNYMIRKYLKDILLIEIKNIAAQICAEHHLKYTNIRINDTNGEVVPVIKS